MLNFILRFPARTLFFVKEHREGILLATLTGVLTGTSYIPFPPWALLFNYAPLWWYWMKPQTKSLHLFWSGWWSQFVLNLIGFFWVYHTAHEFGHLPASVSAVALLLFAALAHLHIPLVGFLFGWVKVRAGHSPQKPWPLILCLCTLLAMAEIYWPYLFQWHMGYTLLWAKLPAYHWADVIGFQGLSFLLMLLNGVSLSSFLMPQKSKSPFSISGPMMTGPLMAALLFLLLNVSGHFHGQSWSKKNKPDAQLRFLPVQANIGNAEKIMAERGLGYQDFITQKFVTLTNKALSQFPEAEIIVWPESALPFTLDDEFSSSRRNQFLKAWLRRHGRSLITGAYSLERTPAAGPRGYKTYNALFFLDGQGQSLAAPYLKTHLLAFGEYTPLAEWFPVLNEISPVGSGFQRGKGPEAIKIKTPISPFDPSTFNPSTSTANSTTTRTTNNPATAPLRPSEVTLAPQICYEALYPSFSQKGTQAGAEILINVTNDSWFGAHSEPYQHQTMTFARAIENRRPLLRVTNTGFTSAMAASGETFQRSPLYEEWFDLFALKYRKNPSLTLYTRYGNFWPLVVGVLLLLALGLAVGTSLLKPPRGDFHGTSDD